MFPENEPENIYDLINTHNDGIDNTAPEGDDVPDNDPSVELPADEPEAVLKGEGEGEGDKEGDPAKQDKPTDKPVEVSEDEITITSESDLETFNKEKTAYLETVDITPQLQAILDRQEAELEKSRLAVIGAPSIGESSTKLITAVNQIFETDIVDNQVVPNAKPLVEVLRTDYRNEFSTIAREVFEADSTKYEGLSVFEEQLIDNLNATPQKLANIQRYLASDNYQLPIPKADVPKGVDSKFAEAYRDIPEVKRFEIQSLVDDISRLEKEFAEEENEYYKKTISDQLGTAQAKLNAEVQTLQKIQLGIDSQKANEAAANRQRAEAIQKFEVKTIETYNNEIFGMADNFVQELAPKLSFVEGDAQTAQARNILARIQNSLAFEFTTDAKGEVQFYANPTADYYAKQLAQEGVKFDFLKGRELLQNHYKAVRKVEFLEAQGASPAALENAKRAKSNLFKDIKAEQLELLGQITSKFVQSSNKALENKVKAVSDKKQKTRAVITKGGGALPKADGDVNKEIADFNRRVKDGDDLFNTYAV